MNSSTPAALRASSILSDTPSFPDECGRPAGQTPQRPSMTRSGRYAVHRELLRGQRPRASLTSSVTLTGKTAATYRTVEATNMCAHRNW